MGKKTAKKKPVTKAAKRASSQPAKARSLATSSKRAGGSKYDQPGAPWWKKLI